MSVCSLPPAPRRQNRHGQTLNTSPAGTVAAYRGSPTQANFDPVNNDRKWTAPFPLVNIFRTSSETAQHRVWWLGGLGDGTDIKPGNYTQVHATSEAGFIRS